MVFALIPRPEPPVPGPGAQTADALPKLPAAEALDAVLGSEEPLAGGFGAAEPDRPHPAPARAMRTSETVAIGIRVLTRRPVFTMSPRMVRWTSNPATFDR
jgi:hypothetical protein